MKINRLDHLVLTVRNVDTTSEFYERVLGMEVSTFADQRKALLFGKQKINLHQHGKEFEPKANNPAPGSADFCLITSEKISSIIDHLKACGVAIEVGPVTKIGALGEMDSVYIRDPDLNLVEISQYKE
jgi:catechol 2,3-dioxygenase-like lactoylglutathione lyase family enzyme